MRFLCRRVVQITAKMEECVAWRAQAWLRSVRAGAASEDYTARNTSSGSSSLLKITNVSAIIKLYQVIVTLMLSFLID
jgi:hypothetical protein